MLVMGPNSLKASMLASIAGLGERRPMRVLDGGSSDRILRAPHA